MRDRDEWHSLARSWQADIKSMTRDWEAKHWIVAGLIALMMWAVFGGLFSAMVWIFKTIGALLGAILGVVAGFGLFFVALLYAVRWVFRQFNLDRGRA